jgi:hypothetical protein
MSDDMIKVRLLFADEGEYHHETVEIPAPSLEGHERLIDCLREDPEVLRRMHVDFDRLVSAWLSGD